MKSYLRGFSAPRVPSHRPVLSSSPAVYATRTPTTATAAAATASAPHFSTEDADNAYNTLSPVTPGKPPSRATPQRFFSRADVDLPLVVLASSLSFPHNPHPTPPRRLSPCPPRASSGMRVRNNTATGTLARTPSASVSARPVSVAGGGDGFALDIPKDASRLLLRPLDAQRQQQVAFSLNERDQQLEELDKQGRLKTLRQQQERRLAWAQASAAAVDDMLAVWESVANAVRERRTSLQPDGYQTFSFPDGAAVYEGNWKNCHPHGRGCLRRSSPLNDVYEGQWFVGQRCGTGTYHNSEFNILYHGSWLDDKVHGKGELVEPEGVYTGEFVENTLHGYGEYVYHDGHVYKGDWVRGYYEGNGVYLYPSGTKYEGGWLRGCEHGRGTKWFSNGDIYMGEWRHGMPHGTGTLTSSCSTATRVSGQWCYGAVNGSATCAFADGSHYTGEWKRGRFHGQGTYEVPCGDGDVLRYHGGFVNGKRHGYGAYTSATVTYTGQWVEDKKEGEGSLQVRGGGTYVGRWRADVPDGEGMYVSTYRAGCHDELHCEAVEGIFGACESQHEQQRVDVGLHGHQ